VRLQRQHLKPCLVLCACCSTKQGERSYRTHARTHAHTPRVFGLMAGLCPQHALSPTWLRSGVMIWRHRPCVLAPGPTYVKGSAREEDEGRARSAASSTASACLRLPGMRQARFVAHVSCQCGLCTSHGQTRKGAWALRT